jgi:hypothetical protein
MATTFTILIDYDIEVAVVIFIVVVNEVFESVIIIIF